MSSLLPSKTGKISNVIVPYLRQLSYNGVKNFVKFCRTQSIVFQNSDSNGAENKKVREIIFTLCMKLKIAPIMPNVFYHCVCEANDIIAKENLLEPVLFGCTILA
jgi:hypothetical protein